ncbi:hypothetical protein QUA81_18790 [Microcoleus sp. F6_B4]
MLKTPPELEGTSYACTGYIAGTLLTVVKTCDPRRQSILDFRF